MDARAGKVGGLEVKNVLTGELSELDVTAMFVAIGHDPRSGFLEGQVVVDEGGYVEVAEPALTICNPPPSATMFSYCEV